MRGKWVRSFRGGIVLLLTIVLLLGISACGGSNNDKDSSAQANIEAPMADSSSNMKVTDQTTTTSSSSLANSEMALEVAEGSSAPQEALSGEEQSSNDTRAIGGGIGPIADANAGFGRKVIYQANLVMKVEEFKVAEAQLLDLIHLGSAYVLQFSDSRNTNEIGATYVIKVPSEGFSPFLEKIQKIKSLKFEREVAGNDVTEEFVDLAARLKAKQTVETRLLAFMDKATKSDDLIRFSDQLARVQEEIEQIKGRIRFLDQNVAFSTINLRLYQPSGIEEIKEEKKEEDKGVGERISDALSGSTKVIRQFGEGLLVVIAAMLPVLVIVAIVGVPTYTFVRRRNANKAALAALAEEKRKAYNKSNAAIARVDANEVENQSSESEIDPEPKQPKD
ncbi:DUF4349 domain-containing protein [Cohnella sp. WQ 127256]|uniref:DUF4349 domain-containing protein n=1 Tax=Cohnella sp. WQ 127256 TaxID=2938790 RepID=UPI00211894B6|nr:DUF4349 domain-containing protein [Cohnella sp. WQ 127256]